MGQDKDKGPLNTSCFVQILGVGTDTSCTLPSALLFFDKHRFLFNAGEGFQRFCVEHKVKMTKINALLATRVTTEATGGLPGMLLTMADVTAGGLLTGHTGMSIHGPPGLHGLVNAFRTFVNVRDLGLKVMEIEHDTSDGQQEMRPMIKNEAVSISSVLVYPKGYVRQETDFPFAKRRKTAESSVNAVDIDIPSTAIESAVACYVCELPDIPGKFLAHKAASFGVPHGPLYGQLARGIEVVGANGRVVKPEEVMEPSTPGPVIIVIDCPSETFIPGLLTSNNGGLRSWTKDKPGSEKVACIVHLTPKSVLDHPEYHSFINSFPSSVQHILVSESQRTKVPILRKSAELQVRLNALDQAIFPLPPEALSQSAINNANKLPEGCVVGENMLRYFLRPIAKRGYDRGECGTPLLTEEILEEMKEKRTTALELAGGVAQVNTNGTHALGFNVPEDDFVLTFLGTGAAIPSKYRNVTGMLVDCPAQKAAMFVDCGEGSLGQLVRRFGMSEAEEILRRLVVVWISHIHADHHIGVPSLLSARTRLLGRDAPPVLVIGPKPLRRALTAYAGLEPMHFQFIDSAFTVCTQEDPKTPAPERPAQVNEALEKALKKMGLGRMESIPVIHCAYSYGLVLESASPSPWKIVFSGDTRPCEALNKAAKGATLLVHEATFDDSMAEEAIEKKHCTTKEAVHAGVAAGVYRTVLTHFSQRYPKVPLIDDNFVDHVGIAFDLMSVRFQDLSRLPSLVPAIKAMFDEGEEDGGDEAEEVPQMLS